MSIKNCYVSVPFSRPRGRLFIGSLFLSTASLFAQTPAASPPLPPEAEQTVDLPEFRITETSGNPYQSQTALSTSRVAMAIQDIPQTISVVSGDFMRDSMSFRMLDAAKYVTPIVESSLPFGGDRYQIRGFQVSQEFIDGSVISGVDGYSMSQTSYNIERIEVIKGPNAILVPGGSPGGVMNPITKSPFFQNKSSVTLELAQYIGNAVSTDVNRVINDKGTMAARLVAAYWRSSGFIKHHYRIGYMVAPSFTIKLAPTQILTIKGEAMQNRESNIGGLPIDPNVGSDNYARIAPGLPQDWSFGNEVDTRHRTTERLSAELLSTFGDHVTSRLYVMGDHVIRSDVGSTGAGLTGGGGGSRNPFTGKYQPGFNWNSTAYIDSTGGITPTLTATSVPVTAANTWVYTRNNGKVYLEFKEAHVKYDIAARFENSWVKSTTIAGFAGNFSDVHFVSVGLVTPRPSVPANNLNSITYPGYNLVRPVPGNGTIRDAEQTDTQLFVYETLTFLDDRLQLSGGLSRFSGKLTRTDDSGTDLDAALLLTTPTYKLNDTAESFGVVVKPIKALSFFYGHNTSGGTMPGSLSAGKNAPSLRVATGRQNEYGVKTSLMGGKLTATFSYFDIQQKNNPVPNSEYYVLIGLGQTAAAAALQNPLLLNQYSKGWELEATYSLNKNLTVLGNYSKLKARQDVTEVRLRAVPDNSGAAYLDYRFTQGQLKGFGANIGVDYKSDVAGDAVTGYTTSKPVVISTTLTQSRPLPNGTFVANQPSFLVEGRTLVNAGVSYRADTWSARIQVSNLFREEYIQAAASRGNLVVGEPIALKGSITYTF